MIAGIIRIGLVPKRLGGIQQFGRPFLRNFSARSQTTKTLSEIDFTQQPSQFGKQAVTALRKNSSFVLKNLGTSFSSAINHLFTAYDDFLKSADGEKQKFQGKGELSDQRGYFPYGSFFAGSKVCDRFFISSNSAGNIAQPLPSTSLAKVSMKEAADKTLITTQQVIAKIVNAIESEFNLGQGGFNTVFENYEMVTVLDRYLPVTQEKLNHWMKAGQLTKTSEGRIEAFLPHKDLMPLTILIYRNNNPLGLELNLPDESGKYSFTPIHLQSSDEIQAVVILGKVMENLTDGLLQGAEHRVVFNPLKPGETFSRYSINSFAVLDSSTEARKMIRPLLRSPTGPHFLPTPSATYYPTHGEIILENARKRALDKLPLEELMPYPKEDEIEIESETTSHGVVYRRRL